MDIISSLATLSFDKRRSDFFTKELITLLKLIDNKIIDPNILFGSWAGAFGNFQFMPSTIKKYAVDYNKNNNIELKDIEIANQLNFKIKLLGITETTQPPKPAPVIRAPRTPACDRLISTNVSNSNPVTS